MSTIILGGEGGPDWDACDECIDSIRRATFTSATMAPGSERTTLRKRLIRSVLAERRAILLEELRWLVLSRETKNLEVITRSQMNSFNRTVQEHMRDLSKWHIPLDEISQRTIRLVVAMSIYRMQDRVRLEMFLRGESPTAVYQHVVERYGGTYRVHHFHGVELHPTRTEQSPLPPVIIPPSHSAIIIGTEESWTYDDVLASATWKIVTDPARES